MTKTPQKNKMGLILSTHTKEKGIIIKYKEVLRLREKRKIENKKLSIKVKKYFIEKYRCKSAKIYNLAHKRSINFTTLKYDYQMN